MNPSDKLLRALPVLGLLWAAGCGPTKTAPSQQRAGVAPAAEAAPLARAPALWEPVSKSFTGCAGS